ncbi:MAG: ABC transporter ATP-binding protein, partial [Planctomycetota bacterium]
EGRDLLGLSEREMLRVRGRRVAMIFQEPMTCLNPVYTVGDQIVEAVRLHRGVGRREAASIAVDAMAEVGIATPAQRLGDYPHQFSGGMQQRVMIAMALACRSALLLADEPTTALDVTIQAQILALLRDLQRTRGLAVMLITHDLGVVAEVAEVICVMYGGRVVEYGAAPELLRRPLHPYTRALMGCMPAIGARRGRLPTVEGLLAGPDAFAPLDGAEGPLVPWWPRRSAPRDVATGRDWCLHEARPSRWVACWRTADLRDHVDRPPDVPPPGAADAAPTAERTSGS